MKIKLKYPITKSDGEALEAVELRRPNTKEIRGLKISKEGVGMDQLLDLSFKVSGLAKHDFDKIDAADSLKICEEVANCFLG